MMMFSMFNVRLQSFWRDESATASMELVIVFPLLMIVFIAAFETGMILTRQIMLERSLDMAVRVLRLAQGVITDADELREQMCNNTNVLQDCENLLEVDLQLVDQSTYDMPSNDEICAGRGQDMIIRPDNTFNEGQSNEFLLMRVCLIVDRILPISGFGLNLATDESGGLHMISSTILVVEPT